MGGMALGSGCFRVWSLTRSAAPRHRRARSRIAILGFVIPLVLPSYSALRRNRGLWLRRGFAPAPVCVVILTPPTVLMGATLPNLAGTLSVDAVGYLYTANLAGGVLARCSPVSTCSGPRRVVASGVAIMINVAVGDCRAWRSPHAMPTSRALLRLAPRDTLTPLAPAPYAPSVPDAHLWYGGPVRFTALGAEVVWTRQLSLLFAPASIPSR